MQHDCGPPSTVKTGFNRRATRLRCISSPVACSSSVERPVHRSAPRIPRWSRRSETGRASRIPNRGGRRRRLLVDALRGAPAIACESTAAADGLPERASRPGLSIQTHRGQPLRKISPSRMCQYYIFVFGNSYSRFRSRSAARSRRRRSSREAQDNGAVHSARDVCHRRAMQVKNWLAAADGICVHSSSARPSRAVAARSVESRLSHSIPLNPT